MTNQPASSAVGDPNGSPEWASRPAPDGHATDARQYGPSPADVSTNDKMNPMAVVSLVFGLTGCLSLFGIVAGVPALRQIKQEGGRGRGLAITGILLGAIVNGGAAILTALSFIFG